MPSLNLLLQHFINHLMLFDDRQSLKLRTLDLQRIHGPASTADILDLHTKIVSDYYVSYGYYDPLVHVYAANFLRGA
jgi:hypothetical protein